MDVAALEVIFPGLAAAVFNTYGCNELTRNFDLWRDVEYLEGFFEENKNDLFAGFYQGISVEKAVEQTYEEAYEFEKLLYNAEGDAKIKLGDIFKPLHNSSIAIVREKSKAYGSKRNFWLRIYAIRIGADVYCVTGGAIKLTKTMNDRHHLKLELEKLNTVANYLKSKGINDADDYHYIEFSQQ